MKTIKYFFILISWILASNVLAYQVELSTFFATSNSADQLNSWSNVAARADLLSADYVAVYDTASDPETDATPPTIAQSLLPDPFTATEQVVDNGTPSLSATQPFNVYVRTPDAPVLTPTISPGLFSLQANGISGPDYILQTATKLNPPVTWLPVTTNHPAVSPFNFPNTGTTNNRRFYRVLLGP